MKKLLMICAMLITIVVSALAQKVDFTTYDVVAKAGDVTIIVKDNDYRMIIGSVKKPKFNMLMGYSKEQAINRIERILELSNENYTMQSRSVSVCGVMFFLTITGVGENEKYHFKAIDKKGKFDLLRLEIASIRKSIEEK